MTESDRVRRAIRVRLAWLGKKQGALVPVLGLSAAGVSDRMRGATDFRVAELEKVAHFLGVPVSALFEDRPEAAPVLGSGSDDDLEDDPARLAAVAV